MNRREFLRNSGFVAAGMAFSPLLRANAFLLDDLPRDEQGMAYAEGYVFDDRDRSGVRRAGTGLGGVSVSNGREVVRTGRDGKWRLPVDENSILFVIKPSGWQTPLDANNLPQYYRIHKPKGSPQFKYAGVPATGPLPASIDFGLRRQREDSKFRMILFGDPQPRSQKEIDYMAHDVIEGVIRDAAEVDAKFGLSLGDEMFNDLSLYESLNRTIGRIGLPWYSTVGNHDLNFDAPDNESATESFQNAYGPTYYAFDYAKVHFIVLNNVLWHGLAANGQPGGFHGEITADQLEFVKNDLSFVPKDRLVVVAMHIPPADVKNIAALYRLIEDRPSTFSISAHTHVQEHLFLTEKDGWKGAKPHHHLNHATVCGSWWGGNPDERGIPHATMTDGGPNGYSIIEFDGAKYKVTFRPASRPSDEQMSVWLPETVPSAASGATEVLVNVFAGSERSRVEMRIGTSGAWSTMAKIRREDPYYLRLKELEVGMRPPNGYYRLQPPSVTGHIWSAKLPEGMKPGTYAVTIRTEDMFGQVYTASRFVRVLP